MVGKQAWQHPLEVKLLDMKVEVEPIRCRNKSLKIENKDVAGGRFGGQDIGLTESTQTFLIIRYSNKKFIKDAKRFWYILYTLKVQESPELLLNPVIVSRNVKEKVLIESSINSVSKNCL